MRTYTIIGGGCFGRFYTRQLLRWADRRGGPVGRIVVVDRNADCPVAREFDDPRIEIVTRDWVDHLADVLPPLIERSAAGEAIEDRLVPSCYAPHILLGSLSRLTGLEAAGAGEARDLFSEIGTPFVRDLENGSYALSFATWICPVNCIEPPVCPAIKQPLDWDMQTAIANYLLERSERVRSFHVLSCLHEAFGVGTIPMAQIAREGWRLRRRAARGEGGYGVVATVSTCHGVAGALRLP